MHATHFANYQAHEVNMSIWLQGKLFLTLEFKQIQIYSVAWWGSVYKDSSYMRRIAAEEGFCMTEKKTITEAEKQEWCFVSIDLPIPAPQTH